MENKAWLMITLSLCCLLGLPEKKMYAHEPLFGLGPESVRKGKYAIDGAIEYEKKGKEKELTFESGIMYGLTESLALSIEMPIVIEQQEFNEDEKITEKSSGLGKVEARAKYRFWKNYGIGQRNQAVIIAGIRFPTVGKNKAPSLGNQSMDFLGAAALGIETLTASFFGTLKYVINTRAQGRKEGNEATLTLAYGFRPEIANYYKTDWMFYLELDAINTGKDKEQGVTNHNSGGYVCFLGPAVFMSQKNVLIKAGIQTPILEHANGKQEKHDLRLAIGLDLHF